MRLNAIHRFRNILFLFLSIVTFKSGISYSQNTIYVGGSIQGDTIWSADTVKVTGNVTAHGTLTIEPGTYIEFQGHYILYAPNLQAIGTPSDSIIFTTNDTTGFHDFNSTNGGWNGIISNKLNLDYCKVQYVKKFGDHLFFTNIIAPSMDGDELEIKNSDLTYNYSSNGVVIFVDFGSSLKLTKSNISNNMCPGIYGWYNSYLEIDSCVISNNDGGGIYNNAGYAYITNNIIINNNGTGIEENEGLSFISGNVIANNKCGIHIRGSDLPVNGFISNNIIEYNSPKGGIIMLQNNYPIINNIIAGNSSSSLGGGIYLLESGAKLINNTIVNNSGQLGGGVLFEHIWPDIYNCIIRGNTSRESGNQIYFILDDGSNHTFNTSIYYSNIEGGKNAFGGNEYLGKYENTIDELPYFLDPVNGDYSLTDSSPCINAGIPDTTGLNLPDFDLAGNPRIYTGEVKRIDIGAYEYQGEPINRPPCLSGKIEDQEIFVSTSKEITVGYIESDANDKVIVTTESSEPNIQIDSITIDSASIYFKILPKKRWTGTGDLILKLTDKAGHIVSDTFTVKVTNEVCGEITGGMTWDADTIKVTCDASVYGALTIAPGTYVEFQGHYILYAPNLQAIGTPSDSIIFTINDTTGFHDFNSTDGGWNGIRSSKLNLDYCKVQYVKKFDDKYVQRNIIAPAGYGTKEIKNSDLIYNYSNYGVVIFVDGESFNLRRSNISNNMCPGIYNFVGELEIDSCVISNNDGYGIYNNTGYAYITNNIISNNNGAGFGEGEGFSIISGNVIANNKCGIDIWGPGWSVIGSISNNIIIYNSPHGGIMMSNQFCPIINNIIAGNSSSSVGGGIYLEDGGQKLVNNTIVNNSAQLGGGVVFRHIGTDIYNCIIRGNVASQTGNQIYYSAEMEDNPKLNIGIFNSNIEGFTADDIEGPFINNMDLDPQFVDTANFDFHLSDYSPCINAGILDTTGLFLPSTDIDGNPRIYGSRIDAGAYEFQGIIPNGPPRIEKTADQVILPFNTKFLTVNFYDPDSGDLCTLLSVSSNTPEIKIYDVVDNSTSVNFVIAPDSGWLGNGKIQIQVTDNHGNIGLQTFQVIVSKTVCGEIKENVVWAVDTIKVACDVTIKKGITLKIKPGTIVEFNDSCQLNVLGSIVAVGNNYFRITFTSSDTTGFYNHTHKAWKGIRLTGDGIAEFRYCDFLFARNENNGGALSVNSSKYLLSITNCNFHNNYSQQNGGAIYLQGSNMLEFKNNIFFNNRAVCGGAFYIDRKNINIVNNLFYNNHAYDGAAIYAILGRQRYINNTFVGNIAERSGGGLSIYNGKIINCIIWGNEAGFSGKELNLERSVTFSNCIIKDGINGITYSEFDSSFLSEVYSSNPNFVSIPDFNFHLTDSSMAINTGTIDTSGLSLPLFDLDGTPRIYAGINRNIDIGAYEFQSDPVNRKPIILFPSNLFLNFSTSERKIFNYVDTDLGDIHALNINSSTENLKIFNISGDTSGSYFDILPMQNWEGRATITIHVEDSHGNVAEHSCNVLVGHLACGNISDNTIWDADTIHVTCNVTVSENALLKIMPGTVVLFHGFRSIKILGKINAIGTVSEKIIFTSEDSAAFYSVYNNGYVYKENIGWNGIYLRNESNDTLISVFKYCIFKYSSNSALCAEFYPCIEVINCEFKYNMSGAVDAWNARSLIKNCIFTNNTSRFLTGAISVHIASIIDSCIFKDNLSIEGAGAVLGYSGDHMVTNSLFESNSTGRGSCIDINGAHTGKTRISKNIFINNTSFQGTGAAVLNSDILFDNNLVCKNIGSYSPYVSAGASGGVYTYGSSTLINNTIVYNKVSNGTGGGLCIEGYSVPVVYNTIIYGNESRSVMNQIHFYNGNSSTGLNITNSSIQGGREEITGVGNILMYENNIESNPKFLVDTLKAGTPLIIAPSYLALTDSSHCINAGISDTTGLNLPTTDLDGNPRIFGDTIDIGAYEYIPDIEITEQPQNVILCINDTAHLAIKAKGVLDYQWQKNGVDISGANQEYIIINNITVEDSGAYNCIIEGINLTLSSDTVNLTVNSPPEIVDQSVSADICQNSDTALYVDAISNIPLDYSWYKDGKLIENENDSLLYVKNMIEDYQGMYYCDVSNECGNILSDSIPVIFNPLPVPLIMTDTNYCSNDSVIITVKEDYSSYLWNDRTTEKYCVVDSSGIYWVEVSNEYGCRNRDTVIITVNPKPKINLGEDKLLCPGQKVKLDGGDEAEKYLWSDGSSGRYNIVDNPGIYWVEVTNSAGCTSTDTIAVNYHYAYSEKLAFVSYDNITGKNIAAWNKTPDKGTTEYIIHRLYEDNYIALDTISYNSGNNYFIDELARPSEYSHIYYLTTKDTCDNESEFDNPHKMLYISGYKDLVKGITILIEKYVGIDYNKYYIFKGDDIHNLDLTDSIYCTGFYTTYSDFDYPYNETYYQVGVKLPEKYKLNEIGREFEYSLSNLYLKSRNNTAPYEILISNDRIDENMPEGTEIGTLSALDYDLDDQHTFSLVSGIGSDNNDYFQININKLISAMSFDYESNNELIIRIRAVDGGPGNLLYDKVFKIYVNDLFETGLGKALITDKILVIPNPVKEKALIIFNNNDKEEYVLYLMDMAGQPLIVDKIITTNNYSLDCIGLNPGIYILLLKSDNKIFKTKVIIK